MLKALLIALDCQRNGGEFSFAAKTEKSKGDMAALVAGRCSSCASDTVMVILITIPLYVRDAIVTWLREGH